MAITKEQAIRLVLDLDRKEAELRQIENGLRRQRYALIKSYGIVGDERGYIAEEDTGGLRLMPSGHP